MRTKLWPATGALLLALGAVTGCGAYATASDVTAAAAAADSPAQPAAPASSAPELGVRVSYVVEGDVVQLTDDRQVRVLGIDAPDRGECGYDEAKTFTREMLLDRPVQVTADTTQPGTDRGGRIQLYLSADLGADQDFATAAARAGWAQHSLEGDADARLSPQIEAAELEAQNAGRGIWGPPCSVATS